MIRLKARTMFFLAALNFHFWRWGTPQRGFPTLSKTTAQVFIRIGDKLADMEKDEKIILGRLSPTTNGACVDSRQPFRSSR